MVIDENTLTIPYAASEPTGLGGSYLVPIYGGDLGRPYKLDQRLTIGRSVDNTLSVDVASVSRKHALVWREKDRFYVRDLNSTNGTFCNGMAVHDPVELENGDHLKVGGVVIKFISGNNVESLYYEAIYRLTIADGLTGLFNRRYLMDFLEREMSRAFRHGRPLSMALIDIDLFKQINDTFGHVAGDHVLIEIARAIDAETRREDLIARFGGEEFALILTEAHCEGAAGFCERLRQKLEGMVHKFDDKEIKATVSIGVASPLPGSDSEGFIIRVDEQLYRAKEQGRNQVCAAF